MLQWSMTERKRFEYNPYQMPFDWSGTPRELGQHVREIREPLFVRTPMDAVNYLLNQVYVPFDQFKQEQLYVLLLDQKNRITHDVMVYKGTVNTVNIRVAELFREAVRQNSPSILLSHCHPSGDSSPSNEDVMATSRVYEAGKLLEIALLDHIIIGDNQYFS